jgi:nucleotide-binding universal stress UspA family protein
MVPFVEKALVAVNDSEAALHAFLQAIQLSRRLGFRLYAVSVAPPYRGDLALVGVRSVKQALGEPIATVLQEALKIAKDEGVGLETFCAEGEPHASINALAESKACDLVIIGQAKRTRWNAWDSLTARLIRDCHSNLLVIPQNRTLPLERILWVDAAASSGQAARRVELLARTVGAELQILRAAEAQCVPNIPAEKLAQDLPDTPTARGTVEFFYRRGQMLHTVACVAARESSDLLFIQAEKKTRWQDKLTGGWPLHLLRHTFLPTWFFKPD